MKKSEILLTLAKTMIELEKAIGGPAPRPQVHQIPPVPQEGSPEHREHLKNQHYSGFYHGARAHGADHVAAHSGATQYATRAQTEAPHEKFPGEGQAAPKAPGPTGNVVGTIRATNVKENKSAER